MKRIYFKHSGFRFSQAAEPEEEPGTEEEPALVDEADDSAWDDDVFFAPEEDDGREAEEAFSKSWSRPLEAPGSPPARIRL